MKITVTTFIMGGLCNNLVTVKLELSPKTLELKVRSFLSGNPDQYIIDERINKSKGNTDYT